MKKLLAILLCVTLLFSLAACGKLEITPTSEIVAIRDDTMSYPDHKIEYNNEVSAKTLKAVKRKSLQDYQWSIGGTSFAKYFSSQGFNWKELQEVVGEDSVCLRYNYGKYYAVIRVNDGSYLFALFSKDEQWSKNLSGIDSCFIKKLSDVEKADRIKVGDSKRKVKSRLSNYWSYELVDLSPPLEDMYCSRFSDLTTRTYVFEDGKLENVYIKPAEESVLTYLLPQDLALIS